MIRLCLIALASIVLLGGSAEIAAAFPPVPKSPANIPPMPSGKQTHCTTKGPKWVAGPGHGETQGFTRVGYVYRVNAWGITCRHARTLLRAFFPKMPNFPMGNLKHGPKGYRCRAAAPVGTRSITNLHDGSCVRLNPSATFDWGPTGPSKPGPYVVLP